MKAVVRKSTGKPRVAAHQPARAGARRNPPAEAEVKIGLRLKHARLVKGMSLREVAVAAGCSESFVSKLENDKVRPSLAILHRLVRALEINISLLFSPPEDSGHPVKVMRAGSRPVIRVNAEWQGKDIRLEQMMPQVEGALLQANIHHVAPRGSSVGRIQHEGQEVGWVVEGEIELIVDNVVYRLKEGDSFYFSSMLAHGYRNPGKKHASVFWVNSPPSF